MGFTIPYGPFTMKYQFTCKADGSGQLSEYIPLRQSESLCGNFDIFDIFDTLESFSVVIHLWFAALFLDKVKISPDSVRVLVGDTLYLNCSGQTTYNGRINFTWDFPRLRVSICVDAALYASSPSVD